MTKPWILLAIKAAQKDCHEPMWQNEPTKEIIEERRRTLLKRIRKFHSDEKLFSKLHNRLDSCGWRSPCGSGACARCTWLFQRWFVKSALGPIKQLSDDGVRYAINIVPAEGLIQPDRLYDFNVANLNRTFKSRLNKSEVKLAITGLDISYNVDGINKSDPTFSIHYYCIAPTNDEPRLKKDLKAQFPKSSVIKRPVMTSAFNNTPYRRSYALKLTCSPTCPRL